MLKLGLAAPGNGKLLARGLHGYHAARICDSVVVSPMFQSDGPHQDRGLGKVLVAHLRQQQSASGQCQVSRVCGPSEVGDAGIRPLGGEHLDAEVEMASAVGPTPRWLQMAQSLNGKHALPGLALVSNMLVSVVCATIVDRLNGENDNS